MQNMLKATPPSHSDVMHDRQKGIALITVLLFLFIMTLIAMSAMQSGEFQSKASGNLRDQEVSFQAAEVAVRSGENFVLALGALPNPLQIAPCAAPPAACAVVWQLEAPSAPVASTTAYVNPAFWNAGQNLQTGALIPGSNAAPLFVVEHVGQFVGNSNLGRGTGGPVINRELFRVTGRGVGSTNNAITVIQTTYGRVVN